MGLTHTVSGDIASFRTPSKVPIESLKFHFLPKQASGTPSPENPIPIEGWTGLNGKRSEKNLYSNYGLIYGKWILGTGEVQEAMRGALTKEIPVSSGEEYSFSFNGSSYLPYSIEVVEYDKDKNYLRRNYSTKSEITAPPSNITFTVGSNTKYIVCGVFCSEESAITQEKIESYKMQLERGSVSSYEPYSGEQIPITFPTTGKNLVNDELTTPRGWTSRSEHRYTNTKADTREYVSLSVQPIDKDNNIMTTYSKVISSIGRDGITFNAPQGCKQIMLKHNGKIADLGIYIPWDGRLGTYTISANFESLDITTIGGFIFSDVQIEIGNEMTSYEVYSSDNTFYGGYIDPVAGEIVAEWGYDVWTGTESIGYNYKNTNGAIYTIVGRQTCKYGTEGKVISNILQTKAGHGLDNRCSQRPSDPGYLMDFTRETICDLTLEEFNELTASQLVELVKNYIATLYSNGTPLTVCYKLLEPIHIPIPAEDMKAFLDYNNFWSDANDVTEVTYAITESKDIQAARKRFEAEENGHHKLVRWNQRAPAMDSSSWQIYPTMALSGTIANGLADMSYVTDGEYNRYKASIYSLNVSWTENHYYYLSYMVKPTYNGKFGVEFAGGRQVSQMATVNANEWGLASTIRSTRPGDPANSGIYIPFPEPPGSINDGFQIKSPILVDLTQMFGEGNEPATAAEFERICALNGIDLTTYQPYDSGSDRWLIIP